MVDTIDEAVEDVQEQLGDVDMGSEEIHDKLTTLHGEYAVPLNEAVRSVINSVAEEEGIDPDEIGSGGGNDEKLVNEISEDENWINISVKVTDLWDDQADSISQAGLLGDESGENKFVSFESSDLAKLEIGKSYRLENVVTDEYQGDYSLKLNKTTEITELDEDVEVGDNSEEVSGALVNVSDGSGLIKRCPQENCSRVLDDGRCTEHGQQDDSEFDLRIKGSIDTGFESVDVIFQREATEDITGITLEEAQKTAKEELDIEYVLKQMKPKILGSYFTVRGNPMYGYIFADEYEEGIETETTDSLLVRARSI